MERISCSRYLLRIPSVFIVLMCIGFCTSEASTDIQDLNGRLTALTRAVETVIAQSKLKDNKLEELKTQWLKESKRMDRKMLQESKIKNHKIEVLQRRVSDLERRNVVLKDSVDSQRQMEVTHRIHKRVPELPPTKIAFHASFSHDNMIALNNAILKFDSVLLDTANTYKNMTGVFTVPETGIYVITWTTSVHPHAGAYTMILINGKSYGNSYSDSDNGIDNDSDTGIIVLKLIQGDDVHVEFEPSLNFGQLDTKYGQITFSAWKL